MLLYNTGLL